MFELSEFSGVLEFLGFLGFSGFLEIFEFVEVKRLSGFLNEKFQKS